MSRSIRRTPVFGNTAAKSEKKDKKRWNKVMRRHSSDCILKGRELPARIRAVTNRWDGRKDGKRYRLEGMSKYIRKVYRTPKVSKN